MATRFYFPAGSAYAVAIVPAFDAGWGSTSGALRRRLLTTKVGEALINSNVATLPNTSGTAAAGANALIRQYVSDPLLAQTLTAADTLSSQCMMRETSVNHNIDAARVSVRVFSGDGGLVRGTLLAIGQRGTTGNEFTNASGCRNVTVITAATAVQNTVAVQEGDRLVFEIGGYTSVGGTGTPVVIHRVGDNATDLPINDTQATDGAGWFEISANLLFQPFQGEAGPAARDGYRKGFRPGMHRR